jgi:hypothetical protein
MNVISTIKPSAIYLTWIKGAPTFDGWRLTEAAMKVIKPDPVDNPQKRADYPHSIQATA